MGEFKEKRVALYGVSAEPQRKVDKATRDWHLDYQVFSDQSHVLRNYLSEQGMVSIQITGGGEHPSTFSKVHPFIKLYPNGVAQPGLVCIKPDRSVLFSWAIEPSLSNLGGGTNRPVPREIWGSVQAKLADPTASSDGVVAVEDMHMLGMCSICALL